MCSSRLMQLAAALPVTEAGAAAALDLHDMGQVRDSIRGGLGRLVLRKRAIGRHRIPFSRTAVRAAHEWRLTQPDRRALCFDTAKPSWK
jgi:hypothetical protein